MNFNSYIVSETKTAFSLPLTSPLPYNYKPSRLVDFKKKAFTLAEVLITLSIIGVVAAMTVPTLMANVNKQIYVTGLKKVYNQLQNAVKLIPIAQGCSPGDYRCADLTTEALAEQLKLAKDPYTCGVWGSYDATCLKTQDGSIIYATNANSTMGSINSTIGVDVNGEKGPNIMGRDRFVFENIYAYWSSYAVQPQCYGFLPVGSKQFSNCLTDMYGYNYDYMYWKSKSYDGCNPNKLSQKDRWYMRYNGAMCAGRVLEEGKMDY